MNTTGTTIRVSRVDGPRSERRVQTISKLASDSIRQGYDRKADRENDFDDVEDPDVRREVMRTIAETPGRKGRG